jgi:hypothetical protein
VVAGVSAVAKAVNDLAASCPDTQIVLVGYSQVLFLDHLRLVDDSDRWETGSADHG